MKHKLLSCMLMVLAFAVAKAQECNCATSFSWMVNTFENNDAGFQYVIDKKGGADYRKHTAAFKEKSKKISSLKECGELMSDWLHYFRHGHIFVAVKEAGSKEKESTADAIRRQYKNEKTIDLTQEQLISHLEKKKDKNPVEGVWANNSYTLGITEDEKQPKKFIAFIIQADGVYWLPKQVKAELTLNDDGKTFSSAYYMQNHSKQISSAFLAGNSLLYMGSYWTMLYPKSTLTKKEEMLVASSTSQLPFVESLSAKTAYLRIPSFAIDQKKSIDSVIAKFDALIKSTPNLIIDIRNGTGGADAAYEKIIPYLYTNPIRSVGMLLLATDMNALAYEKYSKQYNDTASINFCNRVAAKMRQNKGKFIQASDQEPRVSVDSSLKVLPYPQKVGIIFNRNNGSTDEQFLIDAKQSTKVKTFGRPSGGMLDISNMSVVDFPDGKFVLGYCMSKSYRIPDYCIDGIGIQPDYFIDDAIPQEDWIDYTKATLER